MVAHDRHVPEHHVVPRRPPPGPWPGGVLGVAAGLLLAGSAGWRPFGTALLVAAGLTVAVLVAVGWYAAHLG